jgi:thiol-disulfide isomerase/thioredoxin
MTATRHYNQLGGIPAILIYSCPMASWFAKFSLLFLTSVCAVAQSAPQLDLQDLKGGHHKLEDYKGKIVLLNFWATWCVPCAAEMPLLGEMQARYKDKMVVLAASIDDPAERDKLAPFLKKHKAGNLTLMVGPTLDTLSDLGMGSALPDTMFFDAEGKLVSKSVGALKRPDLEHRLAQMTGTPEPIHQPPNRTRQKARNAPEK